MGVRNIDTLSAREHAEHEDRGTLRQEQATFDAAEQRRRIEKSDAKFAAADREIGITRSEVEERFAREREEIDAKCAKKVETAEEQRVAQQSRNLERREDALGRVGLNPDGSNPAGRPQAVVDRETRKVIDVPV